MHLTLRDLHLPEHLDSLEEQAHARIEDCMQIAERHFKRELPRPEVLFNLTGARAGTASRTTIRLNWAIMGREGGKFIARTPGHEAAHFVVWFMYGNVQPHGWEWCMIMRLFGQRPERCHSFNTEGLKRKVSRVPVECGCGNPDRTMSVIRYNKMVRGSMTYTCTKCKQPIRRKQT